MSAGKSVWIGAAAGLLLVAGCAKKEAAAPDPAPVEEVVAEMAPEPAIAKAVLQPRADTMVTGWVTFTQVDDGVAIEAHVEGLSAGLHGFHVHATGDCSSDDFKSTGGHFNPSDVPHGAPTDLERHSGDLGNIEAGEDGTAHLIATSTLLTLDDGPNSVVGKGVIVHEKADDLKSQPTGAAGSRVACGVVELVAPEYADEGTVAPPAEAEDY